MNIHDLLKTLTPETYNNLKRVVEIRKWPDGRQVSEQELGLCMQAIIAYEFHNLPEEQRTGYIPSKTSDCESLMNKEEVAELKWQNDER